MGWSNRTPLAWSLLAHDKKRLGLWVTGVAFAVFLMFVEMGFMNTVYDSQTLLLKRLNADLVMVSRLKDALAPAQPFSRQRLVQALQIDGVRAACPVYLNLGGNWKGPNQRIDTICVIGFDPRDHALQLPELDDSRDLLQQPDLAMSDVRARPFLEPLGPGVVGELNGRRVHIAGEFTLGTDFRIDGRLIMSDRNFVQFFPDPQTGRPNLDRIELGLITAADGTNLEQLRRRIEAALPGDIRVVAKTDLIEEEKRFWAANQPVGIVFGLGMFVGFVIGLTICYQILFTDVNDHLKEFATLKAIGHSSRFLVRTVLGEGLYLSLTGFLPGVLLTLFVFRLLEGSTGLSMHLTGPRVAVVFVLTVAMCLISATLAVRKVLASDPAEVF